MGSDILFPRRNSHDMMGALLERISGIIRRREAI
jgi:hypothetical protein